MLGISVRVLAAAAVAASLAAPVAAHMNSKRQLDTQLVDLRGEVLGFDKPTRLEEPGVIYLLIKNSNHKGERQAGEDRVWAISVDQSLMKTAGLTQATLIRDKEVTITGYRVADDRCAHSLSSCYFAARQIRFDSGCTAFVGKAAPVFGRRAAAWAWNVPDDGLDAAGQPRCFD